MIIADLIWVKPKTPGETRRADFYCCIMDQNVPRNPKQQDLDFSFDFLNQYLWTVVEEVSSTTTVFIMFLLKPSYVFFVCAELLIYKVTVELSNNCSEVKSRIFPLNCGGESVKRLEDI